MFQPHAGLGFVLMLAAWPAGAKGGDFDFFTQARAHLLLCFVFFHGR